MNKTWKYRSAVVVSVFLGGCSPLQQAPLVYSSKISVGVDLSSNVTESPGVSISLGVKTVDAAYVPIAVSKELDARAAGNKDTVAITEIVAKYGQGATNRDPSRLTEENKQKINAYIDSRKLASDATELQKSELKAVTELKRQLSVANDVVRVIDSLPPIPVAPVADAASGVVSAEQQEAYKRAIQARNEAIQTTLNPKIVSLLEPSISSVAVDALDVRSTRASLLIFIGRLNQDMPIRQKAADMATADATAKNARAEDLFTQAAQAASLLETSKTDAMSVYGRFDSNGTAAAQGSGSASAPSGSGGLLVGKVFSTGLASQNLTEATKLQAVSSCISNALIAAGAASAPVADRATMVTALSSACAASVK